MLNLVSYSSGSDSGSDEEDTHPVSSSYVTNKKGSDPQNNLNTNENIEVKKEIVSKGSNIIESVVDDTSLIQDAALFSVLPSPKTRPLVLDSALSKKLLLNKPNTVKTTKKSVKISVPALSEFDEDLPRPLTKKVVASGKGSKLFDLLPPPKNSGSVVQKKLMPDILKKKEIPKKFLKLPAHLAPKPVVTAAPEVEDDSDDDDTGDFFSLNKPAEPEPVLELPLPVMPSEPELEFMPVDDTSQEVHFVENTSSYPTADFVQFNNEDLALDDEAIQKLCGGGKRKRTAVNAEIIDVLEKDVIPDKKEWLMKALTEQKKTRSHKKSTGPSSQQKRKHQITYLAFQAKEQEEDLQTQWASNRMTKKQTQSKYGF